MLSFTDFLRWTKVVAGTNKLNEDNFLIDESVCGCGVHVGHVVSVGKRCRRRSRFDVENQKLKERNKWNNQRTEKRKFLSCVRNDEDDKLMTRNKQKATLENR